MNMVTWTLFWHEPRSCSYRSFFVLRPLAHVQTLCDVKMHANKLEATLFHQQITLFMLRFTRIEKLETSSLIHTSLPQIHTKHNPIYFPINRGSFCLIFQASRAKKSLTHWNSKAQKNHSFISLIQVLCFQISAHNPSS